MLFRSSHQYASFRHAREDAILGDGGNALVAHRPGHLPLFWGQIFLRPHNGFQIPDMPHQGRALAGVYSEVLEDMEFEPMFDGCKSSLKGKRVALFGSYGWGGGEWMHNWERDCRSSGIQLACDSVICNEAPDDAALAACQALGKALVG